MDRLSISRFFKTPQGQLLVDWEQAFFASMLAKHPATMVVQVGTPELNTMKKADVHTPVIISENAQALTEVDVSLNRICAHYAQLPIESESIDCVIVPHTLDWTDYPEHVLKEITRILAPQGRIMMSLFNPTSLWWMRQRCMRFGMKPYLPNRTTPKTLQRWKDWLQLMGLHLDRGHYGLYRPAFNSLEKLHQWSWLDKAGDRWFAHLANVIVISAVKNPVKPSWVGQVKRPLPMMDMTLGVGLNKQSQANSCQSQPTQPSSSSQGHLAK